MNTSRPLYKIPVPEYLSEPVTQSKLKEKLGKWGAGIVKPDVLAGKRGKAGLVRKVESFREALRVLRDVAAEEIHGQNPRSAYIVQSVPADLEIFTAISYNSHSAFPRFTVSLRGGMDVEAISEEDKVTVPLNVFQGLNAYQASEALTKLGVKGKLNSRLSIVFVNLWDMFISTGMLSCEVNPWRVTKDGRIWACDFKATFDENNFKSRDLGLGLARIPVAGNRLRGGDERVGRLRATRARRTSPRWAASKSCRSSLAAAPAPSSPRR